PDRLRALEVELAQQIGRALEGARGGVEREGEARRRGDHGERSGDRRGEGLAERRGRTAEHRLERSRLERRGADWRQHDGGEDPPRGHCGPRRPTIFQSPSGSLRSIPVVVTSRWTFLPVFASVNSSRRVKVAAASSPWRRTSMPEIWTFRSGAIWK